MSAAERGLYIGVKTVDAGKRAKFVVKRVVLVEDNKDIFDFLFQVFYQILIGHLRFHIRIFEVLTDIRADVARGPAVTIGFEPGTRRTQPV